ncbi:MAG TPA: matrixin family metalloprotease [Solirubrobacteraceae bacterium]|nr:matrixin family metalloprotease [Solirubrobacteraceae bacterium]
MPDGDGPFFPSSVGLAPGATGSDVDRLQEWLRRLGYLKPREGGAFDPLFADVPVPDATPGTFDEATADALRSYQLFHGLPPTAELDLATVADMSSPRCGFPDVTGLSRFAVHGNRWPTTNLRYGFANFTGDLGQAEVQGAVRQACTLWSAVTPLTFREVAVGEGPEITIQFASGDHGDGAGNAFDGPAGVLAHAFFPPPNGGDIAGDMHFDEAETWTTAVPVPPGGFDLITVAAHELGHALGLDHSSDAAALMFPTYAGPHRFLSPDDVAGIQRIYGTRTGGSDPTIRRGSRGDAVRRLQQALTNLGFSPGPVDGIFGQQTEAAVRGYQSTRGLKADGIVGPQTWGALHADGQ